MICSYMKPVNHCLPPAVEHLGLLLPAGRGHHPGAGERGGCPAETGPGERRGSEQTLPPRPSLPKLNTQLDFQIDL